MLTAVRSKPSYVGIFVDDVKVVVGFAIERHADVCRTQKAVVVSIVAGNVDVVATQSFVTVCSKVKCQTITHHERVVDATELPVVIDTL